MNDNLFYMDKDGNLCRNNHPAPMNDRIQEIREALEAANNNAEWSHGEDYLILHATDYITYLLSEVERLQEVNKLMKEALEWYADPDKHEIKQRLLGDFAPISLDKGEKARAALSHLKGE